MLEILQVVVWLIACFAWYRAGRLRGYNRGHSDAMKAANRALTRVLDDYRITKEGIK